MEVFSFFSTIEAIETLYILTYDLQIELEDFLNKDENLELKDAWEELSSLLKKLTEEYNQPQRYNNFEEECNGPLGRLRNIIFPEVVSKTEEPLRLFLVNDRIWVVARSKKEATEEVKKELGLINVKISCIENSEVMENGMKASDMIALSDGKVKIIGRTE